MQGMYDIHCHLLPGVDDGAKDLQMSLELLKMEQNDGVDHILVTPHFRRRMFETLMSRIQESFDVLQKEAEAMGIHLALGCEYHVNMDMADKLDEGFRPTMNGTRYVLSEYSPSSEADFIRSRSYDLISHGYIPVLAHIERYDALRKDLDLVDQLSEMGCKIQINAGSILGKDGLRVRMFCGKLLKYGMVDLIGSDAHDLKKRVPCIGACAEFLEKKVGKAYTEALLCENPAEMFRF